MTNETSTFNLIAPNFASSGKTFARFRFSTQPDLAPTGQAPDGEVEDYTVILGASSTPIARPDSIVRFTGESAKISELAMLANDTDPDGGSLTITTVTSLLPSGARVRRDNGWVIYEPPAGYNLPDSFTYVVRNNQGATATGTVNVTLWVDDGRFTRNDLSITLINETAIVRYAGIPGRTYEIQTTSSLASAVIWAPHPAGPQMAKPDGTFEIIDQAPPSPRFYRAIQL